jgi:hypothetical protein
MSDAHIEVADIFCRHADQYCQQFPISPEQLKVLNLIKVCRTAALGGHLDRCEHCGYEKPAYNSCRNRHCPKCQTVAKEKWLDARRAELLPCGYFHLVFTLPHELNPLILGNKEKLLGLLFSTVNHVLQSFARDPQWRLAGKIGYLAVLHTWSQTLLDHFHLHCLVPAGVLSFNEQKWIKARKTYLFRIQSLAKAIRHHYIQQLTCLYQDGQLQFAGKAQSLASPTDFGQLVDALKKKDWIVYAKRPFAGPQQVLEYLGRYTHRVAISNHRLLALENNQVTFTYRDRSDGDKLKRMTVAATEFIRRFLLHVLPAGFVKIRYCGFMAHRHKQRHIRLIRKLIDPQAREPEKLKLTVAQMMLRLAGIDITCCPQCGQGKLTPQRPLVPIKATLFADTS